MLPSQAQAKALSSLTCSKQIHQFILQVDFSTCSHLTSNFAKLKHIVFEIPDLAAWISTSQL